MAKPVLLIGLPADALRGSRQQILHEQFKRELPEYRVIIVEDMRSAIVLDETATLEPDYRRG